MYQQYIVNMMNSCVICQENDNLLNYNHGCGKYHIHEACLYKWKSINGNKCVTCQNKVNDYDKVISNQLQIVIKIPTNVVVPQGAVISQGMIEYKKKLCQKRAIWGTIIVIIAIIVLFGILSPLMIHLFKKLNV